MVITHREGGREGTDLLPRGCIERLPPEPFVQWVEHS